MPIAIVIKEESYWSANLDLTQAKDIPSESKSKLSNVATQLKFSFKPKSLSNQPNANITSTMADDKNVDESKIKLSNDMSDACQTHCKLCNEVVKLVAMRSHTRSKHNMKITEYKSKFGTEYEIIDKVYHKCGICEQIILLCADSVAVHLKTPGHRLKDPNGTTSHKNYNEQYMKPSKNMKVKNQRK